MYSRLMPSRLIAFRCPEELLKRVDQLALSMHVSRTAVMLEAARLLACHIRGRGGYLIPPYKDKDLVRKLRFEGRRGRPFQKRPAGQED